MTLTFASSSKVCKCNSLGRASRRLSSNSEVMRWGLSDEQAVYASVDPSGA